MSYAVKEMYYTLQGEGYHTGRPAVFVRFAGCNLWSGLERDRAGATCTFCDTDFVGMDGPGGGRFECPGTLAATIRDTWPGDEASRFAVITGGEPMLQVDTDLIDALHAEGFEIAIETNGTLPVTPGIDWICVSPKANAALVQLTGDELKLVYPQEDAPPERFAPLAFTHFFLQPMDGPNTTRNTQRAREYCHHHPQWRISLQTHKLLGIP